MDVLQQVVKEAIISHLEVSWNRHYDCPQNQKLKNYIYNNHRIILYNSFSLNEWGCYFQLYSFIVQVNAYHFLYSSLLVDLSLFSLTRLLIVMHVLPTRNIKGRCVSDPLILVIQPSDSFLPPLFTVE